MRNDSYNPQSYGSIDQFLRRWPGLCPGRSTAGWRLTERIVGHINGLPASRGHLTATDGILCYIERAFGPPYCGHIAWFEPEASLRCDSELSPRGREAAAGEQASFARRRVHERRHASFAQLNEVLI